MTPRAGVKTTLATKRAFRGLPIPSGGPFFFLSLSLYLLRVSYLWHLYIPLN
jgi:hypothetical protein